MKPKSKKLKMKDSGLIFSKAKQLQEKGVFFAITEGPVRIKEKDWEKLKKLTNGGVTTGIAQSGNHVSMKGWLKIGGKRHYMRSRWERNIARYYEWLKMNYKIRDWFYEPKRFMFDAVKRGTNSYLPDFKIVEIDNSVTWVEVKGYLDQKGKTKIKRFIKYFPNEKLQVIEADDYKAIAKQCKNLVGDWE